MIKHNLLFHSKFSPIFLKLYRHFCYFQIFNLYTLLLVQLYVWYITCENLYFCYLNVQILRFTEGVYCKYVLKYQRVSKFSSDAQCSRLLDYEFWVIVSVVKHNNLSFCLQSYICKPWTKELKSNFLIVRKCRCWNSLNLDTSFMRFYITLLSSSL